MLRQWKKKSYFPMPISFNNFFLFIIMFTFRIFCATFKGSEDFFCTYFMCTLTLYFQLSSQKFFFTLIFQSFYSNFSSEQNKKRIKLFCIKFCFVNHIKFISIFFFFSKLLDNQKQKALDLSTSFNLYHN